MSEPSWCKSSFSEEGGNNCIELAAEGDHIALRESTAPATVVTTDRAALLALLRKVRSGDLDRPPK